MIDAHDLRKAGAALDPLVTLSRSAQEGIQEFREHYERKDKSAPLAPASLRRLRKGSRTYLDLQDRLIDLASRYEPLASPDAEPGLDPTLRYAGVSISTAAALTIYDNYLSILTLLRDERLRRVLNDPDAHFGIAEDELWDLTEMLNSKDSRRRLRKLVEAEAKVPPDLPIEAVAFIEPYRRTIESSVSYRYAREKAWKEQLPSPTAMGRTYLLDRLERFKDDAVGAISKVFGNGIGLVETRKGKLWDNEEVRQRVLATLKPLDILLEKTPFRLTDYFIPGHYGHVAIWMGTDEEMEALGFWERPGVQAAQFRLYREQVKGGESVLEALRTNVELNTLAQFLNVDDLAVLRPRHLSPEQVLNSIERGFEQVGKEYDFNFDVESTGTIVCSELPYHVYPDVSWKTEEQLGRYTIEPDDVAKQAIGPDAAFELVLLYRDGEPVADDQAQSTFEGLVG